MNQQRNILAFVLACGTAAGAASAVTPQTNPPKAFNISGATLLENFFRTAGSTNDFIDADSDFRSLGVQSCLIVDRLAPLYRPSLFPNNRIWAAAPDNIHWAQTYSAVGSGNGLTELATFGQTFVTHNADATGAGVILRTNRTNAYYNSTGRFLQSSGNPFPDAATSIWNRQNPIGSPVRQASAVGATQFDALFTTGGDNPIAVASTSPNEGHKDAGGFTIDIAPLDVPVVYFARVGTATTAAPENIPNQAGYGTNPRVALDKDGTVATAGTRVNTIAAFPSGVNINPTLGLTPDASSIFDTSFLVAPVAPITNFGTGLKEIEMSDLQTLYVSGRRVNGENLTAVTRDSGSGTRNAFSNSIGISPDFTTGDGVGIRNNADSFDQLGATFLPVNKQGNNRVEGTVINNRLAIGYVGPERGFASPGWLTNGQCEILGVKNNIAPYNGTTFVRPTIQNVVFNSTANSWVIIGPASLATFGDPKSALAVNGGLGWMEPFCDGSNGQPLDGVYQVGEFFSDINGNTVRDAVETRPGTLNPAMRNEAAAEYINNITRSIQGFVAGFTTPFTPAELIATEFVLSAALDRNQAPVVPGNGLDPTNLVTNPDKVVAVQNDTISLVGGLPRNVLGRYAYVEFGNATEPVAGPGTPEPGFSPNLNSRAGKVPFRVAGVYTGTDTQYDTDGGGLLTYGNNLPLRNLIAFDFNGDGVRDINDATDLIRSYRKEYEAGTWTPPNASGSLAAVIDFNFPPAGTSAQLSGSNTAVHIIGDADGNGQFDAADVRFAADGLLLSAGVNNRAAAFAAIDNAYLAEPVTTTFFFNRPGVVTTLATGVAYKAGDARGDVIGSLQRVTPGWAPIGADNRIDAFDLDYICAQFARNARVTDGVANLNNLLEAAGSVQISGREVGTDFSCDMDGDLDVDINDVMDVVVNILQTTVGDVNLDGSANCTDRGIILGGALPRAGGWAAGDTNCDGIVNLTDLKTTFGPCATDLSLNCIVDADDIFSFLNFWFAGPPGGSCNGCIADWNNDGLISADDIFAYLNDWFAAVPGTPCP